MIEHVTVQYEAFDGMMFDDMDDCLNYEFMLLYDKAGIKFTDARGCKIEYSKEDPDYMYNVAEYLIIDRTKKKENDRFIDWIHDNFGWCLLDDVKNRSESKYRLLMDKVIPIIRS